MWDTEQLNKLIKKKFFANHTEGHLCLLCGDVIIFEADLTSHIRKEHPYISEETSDIIAKSYWEHHWS